MIDPPSRWKETPMTETPPADRPLKSLTIRLSEAPSVRTTSSGLKVLVLKGTEEGGRTPGKEQTAAMFAETADAFLEGFALAAAERGEDEAAFRPKVELKGYWKKNTWTGRDGQTREDWEFRARDFAFPA
jgi:hypothetical protein